MLNQRSTAPASTFSSSQPKHLFSLSQVFSKAVKLMNQTMNQTKNQTIQKTEPQIYLNRHKSGTIDWSIDDSASSQPNWFPTDIGARYWLERRFFE
jgi:hypothetical protein